MSRRYARYGSGAIGPPTTRSIVSVGVNLPAHRVNVVAQPGVEIREVALLHALLDVRDRLGRLLPDLHREDAPEQVRREVAEVAGRPVAVLEDSLTVVGHLQPEELLEARIPGLGEVGDREPAGDELALELEAEDHVQPVARLVGVDADERAVRAVHGPVERFEPGRSRTSPGTPPAAAGRTTPERERAPDDVLPQAALRLVQRGRDAVLQVGVRASDSLTPYS